MHLLSEIELRECFNSGRFHKQPTVFFGTLEYNPGCPLEFTVLNDKMAEIGACWESDIQRVLDNAVRLNPNVRVFNVALQQMQDFKRKVVMAEEAERRFRDGKVISFADPRLV